MERENKKESFMIDVRVSGRLPAIITLLLFASMTCWAQGNSATAHADRAAKAHGDSGWADSITGNCYHITARGNELKMAIAP
jgi:hypothetical protein